MKCSRFNDDCRQLCHCTPEHCNLQENEPCINAPLDLDDVCDPATRRSACVVIGCIVAFLVYVLWP